MIPFEQIPQYTRVVRSIRFKNNPDRPFLIVYFSENSTLFEDYHKLGFRRQDIRYVVVPKTRLPVTRLDSKTRELYKSIGLRPYASNMRFPQNKNIFYDISIYLKKVDDAYHPSTYRQRAGFLIQDVLFKTFNSVPDNYQKVLIYSIDVTKNVNSFINRKVFPLLKQLKSSRPYFNDMLLTQIYTDNATHRKLIDDREYKITRIIQYVKNIKFVDVEDQEDEEVTHVANKIVKKVSNDIEPGTTRKVKDAVKTYLKKDQPVLDKINSGEASEDDIHRVVVASVLNKTSDDIDRANKIAKAVPKKNLKVAVKAVSKQYSDQILEKSKTEDLSSLIVVDNFDTPSLVDDKSPERIFEKRKVDFETNLKNDMVNAFKTLENKEIPLKFESIEIVDAPPKPGEIKKTDSSFIIVKLRDSFGKRQRVKLVIPKIDPSTGTFRVNGEKKCLINQIASIPISFPKPYQSKFESSYSVFHIYSKKRKTKSFLEIYMGSFRIPFLILLSYAFGLENSLRLYGIKYKIVEKRPSKEETFARIPSSYILFENLDSDLKQELANSFLQAKVMSYDIKKEFGTKEYFTELIIKITGRINAPYYISLNIENIVDPVAKQVLLNKQLPIELPHIMKYMSEKCVTGFSEEPNDITKRRIRNSEVLVHLAQKLILASYTEYKEQVLSGNTDAKFAVPEYKLISQFNTLEIVQNMEYANPAEEMATITKISPVGKTVGGIATKEAVQLDARNVHPTYFGNIDPLDTAEGGNIGITQQLTVDAYLTSARGLFGQKEMKDEEKSGILSTSTSLIPFIANDDGNRIIMAANQVKQMLPLKNPDPPIVRSGYESILTNVLSDNFVKRAPCNGRIKAITKDDITIFCKKGGTKKVSILPVHLKSGSGKDTLSTFTPTVGVGQTIKEKQIIAEGSCISQGTISLGRTLLAAYMPYRGYNFEDGIVINEKLVGTDALTSLHGIEEDVSVDPEDSVLYIVDIGQETKKGEPLLRKTMGDIDQIFGFEAEEDESIETRGSQFIKKSPGGKVVDIDIFSNIEPEKFPILKKYINRTNRKYGKPVGQNFTRRGEKIDGILVVFKIEQELPIRLGDKLCNRHGNKGIISYLEKDELMPRTPWGESVDIILNPLGVIGRMNMGQLYELYCGLISKALANLVLKSNNKTQVIKVIGDVVGILDKTKNKEHTKKFVSRLRAMSATQFKLMVEQISRSKSVPIIVPPFNSPSHKEINQALKYLKLKPAYTLTLPEYNTKTKNPVPVGYVYMSKLEHIAEEKLHARSTGPTVQKTLQPTAGKRREGGQRVGEGDTWALLSYNATTVLAELFGPLSDDITAKNEMITQIVQTGDTHFVESKTSPTRNLLNAYFTALMLEEM